ncbi:tyrosine-type recombinase/integrase [Burkholderia pseudomallei]|uniref:tyrosine-type recombinase/integrase n=1 Tax=Burkholderia pseudomallei TaxID=28450 RepID=UPI001AAF96AB|nr:site-specific integrase [Burkholderia pseudomallei]MBO2986437.1 integrase arm-type DNA-binding domain-containing protein [Burkholderia pseudomallei]MBO7918716.1 integrase arm-type DNA-binding domain-containing protein [Burkholderia pseudomallei]
MAGRQLHRLSALRVAKEVTPGHYADGGGLYMQIANSGARSWVFRFKLDGRMREMGLGPLSRVSLGEARKLAAGYREMVREQTDPILARREQRRRQLLDVSADANVTFREAAEAFIRAREPEWRNRKHVQQWGNTLKTYAYPVIGDVRVRDIDTAMIVRILQPIWTKKPETARRVRGRIKAILDAETVMGHRIGANPARYVDHLQLVLPRSKRRSHVKHHPALPWEELPAFIRELEQRPRRAARVLHLLILTATRTNEVRFARPEEFDLDNRVWSIAAERTKSGRPLRVPLCDRAVEIVREALPRAKYGYLFPGCKEGRPLSNMAMLTLLRRMSRYGITVHGFRSTFRDWVAECTDYPDSLAEEALAHVIESQTVAAYRRRDQLERRRLMMDDWGLYCASRRENGISVASHVRQTVAA